MAYFPASCDKKCDGCEMNKCGWCIWMDRSVPSFFTATSAFNFQSNENKITKLDETNIL